jgi:anti-sigma B factor antagonist/stage II sporulation protein AA (anti-sigma F factor antagonist)
MEYALRQVADVTLIRVQGRIDHKKAKDFENELKPLLDDCAAGQERRILLDMSGVDFMTSAGLRVLMIAAKTCGKNKGEIVVAALQPTVEEIFKISRFDLVLKIFPTVEAALDKLSPTAADLYRTA